MNNNKLHGQTGMIFKPMQPQVQAKIKTNSFSLEYPFFINSCQEVDAALTNNFLSVCQKGNFNKNSYYYTEIQFELKFQVIYQADLKKGIIESSIFSKKIGFRLIKQNFPSIEFLNSNENIIQIWIKYLSKVLNQVGFHKLYKPVKKLGKGGFASVYEVQRYTDKKHFAVKAFSKQNTLNSNIPSQRLNLINQIIMMRNFDSPNIIRLEGIFQSENSLYVVLQLLGAGQLHTRINKREGKFQINQIKQFMIGLAKGLKQIHQNQIMHRDIKPQNIMLRNQNSMDIVIVDFGLAAKVDSNDYIFYRCGTPGYVAPEITVLEKGKKVSSVCDIFSAGVIFHILLTKKPLFEGRKFDEVYENNRNMRFNLHSPFYNQIDPVAMNLLELMLKLNPKDRIAAAQILNHPFLQGEAIEQEFCSQKQRISPAATTVSKTKLSKIMEEC